MISQTPNFPDDQATDQTLEPLVDHTDPQPPVEIGGRGGLDPTRYGDWEKNGRCIDF